MGEREGQLGEVLKTEGWVQQVKVLGRCTEELQQAAKTRLQSLQDAAKVNSPGRGSPETQLSQSKAPSQFAEDDVPGVTFRY